MPFRLLSPVLLLLGCSPLNHHHGYAADGDCAGNIEVSFSNHSLRAVELDVHLHVVMEDGHRAGTEWEVPVVPPGELLEQDVILVPEGSIVTLHVEATLPNTSDGARGRMAAAQDVTLVVEHGETHCDFALVESAGSSPVISAKCEQASFRLPTPIP